MIFSVIVFILVLSLLIFVHELGHFVAAKACGVYVDRFSIGMPPRLFGIKIGDTDYCIGALPIGGFVKMAGQEDAPLSDEEREEEYGHVPPEQWFNNRPVWQRFIVLVAGPAMNFVLAIVLYAILAFAGGEVPEYEVIARVGEVEQSAPAATAPLYAYDEAKAFEDYQGEPAATGWQTGDLILAINGNPVDNIGDLAMEAVLDGEGATHHVVLERTRADGTQIKYVSPIQPEYINEDDPYPRFGVGFYQTAKVGKVLPDSPAEQAGLKEGDVITHVDGEPVCWTTFVNTVSSTPTDQPLKLSVVRDGQPITVAMKPGKIGRIDGLTYIAQTGDDTSFPVIVGLSEDVQKNIGIQRKDIITEINGEPATVARLQTLEKETMNGELAVTVQRPSILFGLIQRADTLEFTLPVDSVSAIGVSAAEVTVFHRVPRTQILSEAFRLSKQDLDRTLRTVKGLITSTVSPKELGGPLMIGTVLSQAAHAGILWLLKITAFISVNLCVVNLLPLPVLDGGQIVINAIEGIRRKPLSPTFLMRYQQFGLVLIISLMVFVTWNDIGRYISSLIP